MSSPIVAIRNLTYAYGQHANVRSSSEPLRAKGQQALFNLPELTIESGEAVFIGGQSGTGKSTLLNLISGIWSSNEGNVTVCGVDVASLTGGARDKFRANNLGVIAQKLNLLPYLNAIENVQIASFFGHQKTSEAQITSLLTSLNLPQELLTIPTSQLSLGQQQRIAIARAFVNNPKLIVADEPTSALDDSNAKNFIDLLFDFVTKRQVAVLMVSHDNRWHDRFDRVIEITDIAKITRAAQC